MTGLCGRTCDTSCVKENIRKSRKQNCRKQAMFDTNARQVKAGVQSQTWATKYAIEAKLHSYAGYSI
jgi:hypothetical protein